VHLRKIVEGFCQEKNGNFIIKQGKHAEKLPTASLNSTERKLYLNLKFRYYEKATKISHFNVIIKKRDTFFQIFVAFSHHLNFNVDATDHFNQAKVSYV
jgi:hypothetical protein